MPSTSKNQAVSPLDLPNGRSDVLLAPPQATWNLTTPGTDGRSTGCTGLGGIQDDFHTDGRIFSVFPSPGGLDRCR
jgi:hypothetical protein